MDIFMIISIISVLFGDIFANDSLLIGNYSELNADCGLNRFSHQIYSECFQWHRDVVQEVRDGRDATLGEVPWMVRLELTNLPGYISICSGSLVGNQYVITAAHCLIKFKIYGNTRMRVLFGHEHLTHRYYQYHQWVNRSDQVLIYPDYEKGVNGSLRNLYKGFRNWMYYDIGLAKLDRPPMISHSGDVPLVNSICLPDKSVFTRPNQYLMTAGWGEMFWDNLVLQMGYRKVVVNPKLATLNETEAERVKSIVFADHSVANQSFMCNGDSGGPVWQYHHGHAVLVGVRSAKFEFPERNTTERRPRCDFEQTYYGMYARLTFYIDWILNVTK